MPLSLMHRFILKLKNVSKKKKKKRALIALHTGGKQTWCGEGEGKEEIYQDHGAARLLSQAKPLLSVELSNYR